MNTTETVLCGLKLLTRFVSSVVGDDFEQMKNTGASVSWALRMF